MVDSKALIVVDGTSDPVIEMKRKKLGLIELMAKRFKRIDIKFLAIPSKTDPGLPAFAILPFDKYREGATCEFNGTHRGYVWGANPNFQDVLSKSTNFDGLGVATPACDPTDEAVAIAEDVGSNFDRLMVAWEADWAVGDGDPLLIGEIDGVWFLLANWNMTKLETFIAG